MLLILDILCFMLGILLLFTASITLIWFAGIIITDHTNVYAIIIGLAGATNMIILIWLSIQIIKWFPMCLEIQGKI